MHDIVQYKKTKNVMLKIKFNIEIFGQAPNFNYSQSNSFVWHNNFVLKVHKSDMGKWIMCHNFYFYLRQWGAINSGVI